MSNPKRNLGSREKRLAEMVPRLSEALKRASLALESTAGMCDTLGETEAAATTRLAIRQFDLLTLEADRI